MLKRDFTTDYADLDMDEIYFQMLSWGDQEVAFVKQISENGEMMWRVYTADGIPFDESSSREAAFVLARFNGYEPQSAQ